MKYKFGKPFSSFYVKGSLKEQWVVALRDPVYLFMWFTLIAFVAAVIIAY